MRKLPEGWEWRRLGDSDVCEINPPKSEISQLPPTTEISFIPMSSISEQGTIINSECRIISEVIKGYTYFKNNDVIFAKITPCMENGKTAIAKNLRNGIGFGSTEFHVIRPKKLILADWIHYFIRQDVIRKEAKKSFTGTAGQQRVPASFLNDLKIPLPPLPVQKRIVAILDKADAARRLPDQADKLLDELLRSAFLEMFGDPVRNEKGWELIRLEDVLSNIPGALQSGPFGTHLHSSDFIENGEVLAVGIDNIQESGFTLGKNRRISREKYQELSKFQLYPDDVLVSIMGTVGRVCVFPKFNFQSICTKHVYRINLNKKKILPIILVSNMKYSNNISGQLKRSIKGQIVDAITSKDLLKLKFPLPPFPLQQKFASIVQQTEKLREQFAQSKKEADDLFEALMQKAFTGELVA
ncbi:MAG: restriction endonuclease subunit S [Candidatus Thermoplasmatota archaeon]